MTLLKEETMKSAKTLYIAALALATMPVSVAMAAEKPGATPGEPQKQEIGNNAAPASDGKAVEGLGPLYTRTISGHRIGHYTDGPVPVDLSVRTVAAYFPYKGTYNEIVGTGTSSGTFTIAGVPAGYFLLRLGMQYLWTSHSMVNADYYSSYRSDAATPVNNTTITFNLANLNAWQSTDFFEMVDPNSTGFTLFPGVVGATTFTGTFPYTNALSDSTQGDKTYFIQLVTQTVGGYDFASAGRFFAPHTFVQVDGADTTVSGTLKTVVQNQTFRVNINGADLAAQTVAANPAAVLYDTTLFLDVYPGSLANGQTTSTPDLIGYSFYTGFNPITVNADLGDLSFGNPFPATWPLFTGYQYFANTNYFAPGATNPVAISTTASGYTTTMPSSTNPIRPLVGVPTSPLVGMRNFFSNLSGIGLTPILRWAAPSVGRANAYAVVVYQLSNNAGNSEYFQIARLQTQGTSLRLPPGLLSSGQAYIFLIRTLYRPGVVVASKPYVFGPTNATADVISGVMQP